MMKKKQGEKLGAIAENRKLQFTTNKVEERKWEVAEKLRTMEQMMEKGIANNEQGWFVIRLD